MFVVFEGLEGVGKTTLARQCAEHLTRRGLRAVVVPEFSVSPIGDYLHSRLTKDPFLREPGLQTAITQIMSVAADTAHAAEYNIAPALAQYDVVIKDRYRESLVACQHVSLVEEYGWCAAEAIDALVRVAALIPINPQITFYLCAPASVRHARLATRDDYSSSCAPDEVRYMSLRELAYERLLTAYPWAPKPLRVDTARPLDDLAAALSNTIVTAISAGRSFTTADTGYQA
jgi:thymidylate kinase